MKYAIIGSGKIGTALARVFARKNIEVAIANSRGPETLAPLAKELGPSILPKSVCPHPRPRSSSSRSILRS